MEAGLARPEIAVIPVLTDGASMPHRSELPPSVQPLRDRKRSSSTVLTSTEVDQLVEGIRRGQLSPLRRAGMGHTATAAGDVPLAPHVDGEDH